MKLSNTNVFPQGNVVKHVQKQHNPQDITFTSQPSGTSTSALYKNPLQQLGNTQNPLMSQVLFGNKQQITYEFGEVLKTQNKKKLKEFVQKYNPNAIPLGSSSTDPRTGSITRDFLYPYRTFIMLGAYNMADELTKIPTALPLDIDYPLAENQSTPLNLSVRQGHIEAVKYLLSNGANPNLLDDRGNSPLHLSLAFDIAEGAKDRAEFIKNTLKQLKGDDRASLSDAAAKLIEQQAREEIPGLLLQKGADPNVKNKKGVYPLAIALQQGQWQTAALLLNNPFNPQKQANPNVFDEHGNSALMMAYDAGQPSMIKLLLKKGADLNYKNPAGVSLLTKAVKEGNLEAINICADANANMNEVFESMPLVQHGIANGNPEVSVLLLKKGADPKQFNDYGMNMLHVFLANLTPETPMTPQEHTLFKQLLALMPFEVNTPDSSGVTPLMEAVELKNILAIEALLELDANPNAVTNEGKTVYDFLLDTDDGNSFKDIKLLLKDLLDPESNNSKKSNKLNETETQVLHLLRKNQELSVQNPNDAAVLKLVEEEDLPRLRAILRATKLNPAIAKFNVNARSASSLTPLMLAIQKENTELIDLLIEYGADPTLTAGSEEQLTAETLLKSVKNPQVEKKVKDYIENFKTPQSKKTQEGAS